MNKKHIGVVIAALIACVAYYLISPVFLKVHLDEDVPVEVYTESEIMHEDSSMMNEKSEKTSNQGDSMNKDSMDKMDAAENAEPEVIQAAAAVVGTSGHPSSGEARIINTAEGDVLRYENFKTINGPDLFVYLAKDLEASEFVSLGELKATEGNINYVIPRDINSEDYKYALVWCKQFGVLFSYVDLTSVR